MNRQEQIITAITDVLKGIRANSTVPHTSPADNLRYRITPRLVTRVLSDGLRADQFPVLFATDPSTSERHMMADVTQATMTLFVSGVLYDYTDESVQLAGDLAGDVRAALFSDPTFGGLVLRTRLLRTDSTSEVEEPQASFTFALELDYIDYTSTLREPSALEPVPEDQPGMSSLEKIMAMLHNAFTNLPEVNRVVDAPIWPMPPEQILSRHCPLLYYAQQNMGFDYKPGMHAYKSITVSVRIVDFEADATRFNAQCKKWAAQFVILMGKYSDLSGRITTSDIQNVRTTASEFPVVVVDAEIVLKYYESFLTS